MLGLETEMAYSYHYSLIRSKNNEVVGYSGGVYKTDTKIKYGDSYGAFLKDIKANLGLKEDEPTDFCITSLTLIDDET